VEINTEHIIAYLENRLSAEEKEIFDHLMQDSPELKKEVDDLRFILQRADDLNLQRQIDPTAHWKKVSRRIAFESYKNKAWRLLRSSAAVLLIPALITSYILYNTLNEWNNKPIEQLEVTSAYGLVSKVTLSDGSEVWLNSGSRLSFPERFTGKERNVSLSGEAYFKVSSDKENRFNVTIPGNLVVSAYGTEFNINAYEEDKNIETTLAKGHVDVSEIDQPSFRTLHPGQQVTFNKETNKMDVADANLLVTTSWKDGKMIFRRASMAEIIRRLSRHFNVDIKLEGKEIYNYEYSATFTTESLSNILQLLEKTAPIKCRIIEPEQSDDYSYSRRTVIIRSLK